MIELTIHLRDEGTERRQLATVPREGDYLDHANRLWRVEYILFGRKGVHVYCARVSDRLAAELQTSWVAWDKKEDMGATPRPSRKSPRPRVCDLCGQASTIRPCPVCAAKGRRLD